MTSEARKQMEEYKRLLKTDPLAVIARTAGDHTTCVAMLLDQQYRVEVVPKRVLKQVNIYRDGALIASGSSDTEADALQHALLGYFREQVAARLA